ncbi:MULTISPECIES: methionine biosynthesis protein MetW [Amphritea]|uniref:Methionine biosynthesis protein MetW n=2 Tax=Amphritea TaxID=515417 RepID=A0A1H9JZQ2_9GAMM|nr:MULTISPECIES: methionine biosynthesis protein MetW [Amphritea]MBN0988399.1 methionine biosynthesis protein MetW [Amphritea pacifica]MBN1006655.1 methionine biosynthesis protein MetW [Amphritea pacifica]SEQ92466.1 methionine biosynthesis protein MetW [Amphritea atlantica]
MRADLEIIQEWIAPNSKVLDLGCGNGELLAFLQQQKQITGYGVEVDHDNITACLEKGVNVIEKNIDEGLASIDDSSFDTVIMTQALQVMYRPDQIVDEMLRIGKECIVTFPNFGHWRARGYLAFRGKMPVSKFLPYTWYNTPNIHFCTFKDFEQLCVERNIHILDRTVVDNEHKHHWSIRLWPNMLGEIAIYRITR